ncbi:hypothetical protein NL108_018621 [Boleophthalmus pectinirostris]|nr:hypothetical protein NL108_018621 [Boleophthalmus pectinirostris]
MLIFMYYVFTEMKPSQKGAQHIEIYSAIAALVVIIIIAIFAFVYSKKCKMKCGASIENGSDPEGPSQSRRESKDILLGSHEAEGNEKFKEISQKKRGAPSNFSAGWAAYEDVTAFPRK